MLAILLVTGCSTPSAVDVLSPQQISQAQPTSSFEVLDGLMFDALATQYSDVGLSLDKPSFDRLSKAICNDMQQGGAGLYTDGDVAGLTESEKQNLAHTGWLIFAQSCYSSGRTLSDAELDSIAEFLFSNMAEYSARMEAAGLSTGISESGYKGSPGSGSSGSGSSGRTGSGFTVRCNDGSYSNSGGKQGACSHHGGVSK